MNYFNNINLNQNELQKAVMHPLAQPPADPKQGQMYFNTGNKKLYYYNDTKWVAVNDIDLSNYATIAQLNNKLDKQTTTDSNTQVYAVTGDTQKMINATSAATGNTVVLRDANGKLQVAAGAVAADAVNKGQMDDAIAAAVEAGVSGCERTSNKVGTITDPGNDTQYPNTKAVVNYVKSQVSKVKDVTLDGTSIVNTETGVVALESTYSLTLDGTSGTLKPTEYDNLSGDDASYIWYTQTGVQPIRLTKVMSGEGSLQYQAVVSDTVMAVIIQSDKTWEFAQFNVEKEPYHFTYQWGTVLTAEQKAGIQNDPNCYFYTTLNGVTVRFRRVAVEGNCYYFTSMHSYTSDKVIDIGQVFVEITTGDDRIVSESIYAESLKNKTEVLNAQSTDTQYPTAKAVYRYVTTELGKIDQFEYKVSTDAASTPEGIVWYSGATESTKITGTLKASATTEYTIYLVPCKHTASEIQKGYDEYLTIKNSAGQYVWEVLGNTRDLDLSDYVSKTATGTQDIASNLRITNGTKATTYSNGAISYTKDSATEYSLILPEKDGTIAILDEVVTLSGTQTVTGAKTFSKEVAFDNHIRANGGVGTDGQVLTSQGVDKPPVWKTISAPSNMVTTDTSQTIKASKVFSKEVAFNDQIRVNGSVGTAGQVLTSQGAGKVPQWTTLTIPQGTVKKFVKDFTGNNTNLEFSYEHKLGTDQCTVSLYKLNDSNNYEMVMADIILTTTNVIIKFAQAPTTTDSFRVVVTG